MEYKGVIFDLDGVIVSTDECHYQAWKKLSEQEGISFDRSVNERLRGVSRTESLEIILEKSKKDYTKQKKADLIALKNGWYRQSLNAITPDHVLPGVISLLTQLKLRNIKTAIGSSSQNAGLILEKIGLLPMFDAVADGNAIRMSKPDPEVFLLAASLLDLNPNECVVIEDAPAGITAARTAGAKTVAVGDSVSCSGADYIINCMAEIDIEKLLSSAADQPD